MCVIFIVEDKKPTEEMIKAAYAANSDGAGFAWREGGLVKWKKGITSVEEAVKLAADLPTPYVAHFRISTCGGAIPPLTHPFPISAGSPLDLEGRTKGSVLFHNGIWGGWENKSLDLVAKGHLKIPTGKWSDSRAMAFLASHYGLGLLEFINEKTVAFGPKEIEWFGNGWSWYADGEFWVSNEHWNSRLTATTRGADGWWDRRTNRYRKFTDKDDDAGGGGQLPGPQMGGGTHGAMHKGNHQPAYHQQAPASLLPPVRQPGGVGAVNPFLTAAEVEAAFLSKQIGKKKKKRFLREIARKLQKDLAVAAKRGVVASPLQPTVH